MVNAWMIYLLLLYSYSFHLSVSVVTLELAEDCCIVVVDPYSTGGMVVSGALAARISSHCSVDQRGWRESGPGESR